MNPNAFDIDQKITDVLARNKFTCSAEVIPPRNGAEQGKILSQIQTLIESGAEFLAVTKGAGGSLRGGSLPIAQLIKERFRVPCIAHFTCRDLTPQECENHLIDHHYFGIRNILALRGDPPEGQKDWKPRDGGYSYAYQLTEQISALNQGRYLKRPGGYEEGSQVQTDFCIGAAAYPEFQNPEDRLRFFKLKVQAGAHFGITDMLFDPTTYAKFIDLCSRNQVEVPILPGTRILKSRTQALKMAERFRVTIPEMTLDGLPEGDSTDGVKKGIELFLKLTEDLKRYGAPGVHLYVIGDTATASAALIEAASLRT